MAKGVASFNMAASAAYKKISSSERAALEEERQSIDIPVSRTKEAARIFQRIQKMVKRISKEVLITTWFLAWRNVPTENWLQRFPKWYRKWVP